MYYLLVGDAISNVLAHRALTQEPILQHLLNSFATRSLCSSCYLAIKMHRHSLALLGRAARLGVRAIADASAEAFGSQAAPLSALASLLTHQHAGVSAACVSSLTAAAGPGAVGLPLLQARSLHTSGAALSDDRSAAVRRLAAARTRRAKAASDSDSASARERAAAEEQALVAGGDQQQQTGLVPAASNALTVTPAEGKASEVQLAAALDHPALIVTRPIEWWVVHEWRVFLA